MTKLIYMIEIYTTLKILELYVIFLYWDSLMG